VREGCAAGGAAEAGPGAPGAARPAAAARRGGASPAGAARRAAAGRARGDGAPRALPRTLLHVDIDAFFAAIEQQRNPHLRGRPVIVGAGVITSCSYEARRFGLRAGMPLSEARRLCPEAVI